MCENQENLRLDPRPPLPLKGIGGGGTGSKIFIYEVNENSDDVLSGTWHVPQNPTKSCTFLDFRLFQSQNWENPVYLAPNNFWNPIFGQIDSFYEFSKRYLKNWLIF